MAVSQSIKYKIGVVLETAQVVFHWGFIPTVLFLGFKQGADKGMPPLSIMSLLWQ